MSHSASLYPISQALAKIIRNSGYSPTGFLWAMGHADAEAVSPDLEIWLTHGEGPRTIIAEIAAAYPDEAQGLYRSVAATKAIIAAGVDPAEVERSKEAARFTPYTLAQGELTIPTQICIFGMSGGFERWCTIRIPHRILKRPVEEQLTWLPRLMAKYKRRNDGMVPFFGKLVGFKLIRFADHYQFDADGRLVEHVDKLYRPGECWVELR
jgi:hypothetical protein